MQPQSGVLTRLQLKTRAHAAALRFGKPSHKMKVVLVVGQDGAAGTVAFLASILRKSGSRVGVATQAYVEIAGERVTGSDQADINADPYRLQALLAQMKKAGCEFALVEVPPELPEHQFVGIKPTMVIVRRCGDDHTDLMTVKARLSMLNTILSRKPEFVVYNRDDPSSKELDHLAGKEGVISYGTHAKAECRINSVQMHPKGSAVQLLVDHQTEINLATVLTGKQAIYNAAAAAAGAYVLHAPINAIEDGVLEQEVIAGQLEFIPIQRPYQLVLDAATTPGGLAESLEAIKHFAKNRVILVMSLPLGVHPTWRPLMGEIAAQFADRLVVTDGEFAPEYSAAQVREQLLQGVLGAGGEAKTDEITDREAAIEKAVSIARRGDVIVIAGTTLRAYRQLGTQRLPWSDRKITAELFGME
jgi:UDP-N-acetylmuramoyl-L-alanyl-D-glutamate--2,6-diaminopimelate ligase